MAYNINKFDGSLFATVNDGEINESTNITLIGKNFAGYGELQNENFLHLLENFARDIEPAAPVKGQLWYDTVNKKIRFFTGDRIDNINIWKTSSGAEYSPEPPASATSGDLWYDTRQRKLKIRLNSLTWSYIGPGTATVYANIDQRNSIERIENNLPVPGSIVLILDDGAGNPRFQGYVDSTRGWINLN